MAVRSLVHVLAFQRLPSHSQTPAAVPARLESRQAADPCPRPPAPRGPQHISPPVLQFAPSIGLRLFSTLSAGQRPLESSAAAPTTSFNPCLLAAHAPAVGAPWPPHQECRPARRRKQRVGEGCAPAILPYHRPFGAPAGLGSVGACAGHCCRRFVPGGALERSRLPPKWAELSGSLRGPRPALSPPQHSL
jgi:hypothetical protein